VYAIPAGGEQQSPESRAAARKSRLFVVLWVLLTWVLFAGVLVFTILVPDTTWIGITNCAALTGWSVVLRLIEKANVKLAGIDDTKITNSEAPDAVYILGRNNSAFVLKGTRKDVKYWTTRGLRYQKATLGVPAGVWQFFTRMGSLLMLLFIFSSIPNGSTMDQVAFIILNGLAQINVLVGQRLNSACCMSELELVEKETPKTRTDIYGFLVRRFKGLEAQKAWIDASGLLPNTDEWKKWKVQALLDDGRDVNDIYEDIAKKPQPPPVAANPRSQAVSAGTGQPGP